MRLTWLADVLRDAGLPVREVEGWRTREVPGTDYGPVRGIICHETRGSATSTDNGEIGVLVNGRVGLSGPIAQLYLSRTGTWHVVASGTCHHVKSGWAGPHKGYGNDALIGVEAQHAVSESWANKPEQYRSYVRGVAAILRHTGWPVSRVAGHKEHQPGDKSDPEFDMARFRADVTAALNGEDDDMPSAEDLINADIIPNPYGDQATNKTITLATAVRNIGGDTRTTVAEVKAARIAAERAAVAAERAAMAAEQAGQAQPIDYDKLALALLRNMAAPG